MEAWISNGNTATLVAVQDSIPSGSCSEQPRWQTQSGARAASLSGDPESFLEVLGASFEWQGGSPGDEGRRKEQPPTKPDSTKAMSG